MSSIAANVKKTTEVTPCKMIRGHTGAVTGVAHLPGGQHIVTCSHDSSLRLWDLKSGAQIGGEWRDQGDEAEIRTMALSPDSKTIASGSSDGIVRLWDVETGKVVVKWKGHTDFVTSVCWSPNCGRIVSGSNDETARVWDVESSEPVEGLNPIKTGHEYVYAVRYSPKASMIATGGYNKTGIKIWHPKTGELLSTIGLHQKVLSLTWTSDEKKLIVGLNNGSIMIFNTATWREIAVLNSKGHPCPIHAVRSLTLFPNDRLLASTSSDGRAHLWNLDTNLQIGPPLQHTNGVEYAAFSADGKLLSTAVWMDKDAYIWDIQDILKTAGLEDLLPIPDADATQGFGEFGEDEALPGFFDSPQVDAHSSATLGARVRFSALLGRLPYLLHRSEPNQATDTQQPPVPSESRSRVLFDRLFSLLRPPSNTDEISEPSQLPVPSESRLRVLFDRLSSLLRSPPNTDEIFEPSQPPMISRLSPRVLLGDLSEFFSRPRIYTNEATEPRRSQTPRRSRSDALIGPLSSLFRSPPNADEAIELQCCPGPTTSHLSRHVDDVAAMRDKEVLVVARRPDTASEIARRVKNPKPWVRVVFFLCCVSPGTDDPTPTT
ncbi:WD40 repeat-like protein [Suillus hirtellus]|nr:WD40 repeat-like protein [Suillus hirtellus]